MQSIIAFCFTAFLAILTDIFGYLSDSLDDALMSDLDRHIIQWVQIQLAKSIKNPEPVESRLAEQKRIARKEAIGRFIIMLSDQQLVTGACCNDLERRKPS